MLAVHGPVGKQLEQPEIFATGSRFREYRALYAGRTVEVANSASLQVSSHGPKL